MNIDGMRLPNEEELGEITNQINHQVTNPDLSSNLIPSHQDLHNQPDHQTKEGQSDSNSPTYSSPNSIPNPDSNNQLRYHHDTDHMPTTSNRHSSDNSPSTSIGSSRPSGQLNIINSKVIHSINSFDPNTKLQSLTPADSPLLREAKARLDLEIDNMENPFNRDLIRHFRVEFFKSWDSVLEVMRLADANKAGIPTEFLKKVINPIINHLLIRRNLPEILPRQIPAQTPVIRTVALWAQFWRLLANTNPKPILNDSYISGAMDWIINLVLRQFPIDILSVYERSILDPTNIELRISKFITALDQSDVLGRLTQDLFNVNLRNQVHHFYEGLVRTNQAPHTALEYLRAEHHGQHRRLFFNQYQQYRQDVILLRCALSGLRPSDYQSEWNRITPIHSGEIRQTLRRLMIDRASRLLLKQLESTLKLKQPSFQNVHPFATYLSESYLQVVQRDVISSSTGQNFDQIVNVYLLPMRTWSTILEHMDPEIEVKLSKDMLMFLDEKVREGIKAEFIHNWIYIIYSTFEEIQVENRLEETFINKEMQDWLSDQGRLMSEKYWDVEDIKPMTRWLSHELNLSLVRNRQILLPPVPKFSSSNVKEVSKMSRPSSSQPISKSSALIQFTKSKSKLDTASKDLHLSPPSRSHQVENIPPVPKFTDPKPKLTSQDLRISRPSSSQYRENIPPVPKFNRPSNVGVSSDDPPVSTSNPSNLGLSSKDSHTSPPPSSHQMNEDVPPVPKFKNPPNLGLSSKDPDSLPSTSSHQMNEDLPPVTKFKNPSNLGSSSEESHKSPPSSDHQFLETSTPSSSSSSAVPRFSESSLEDFFQPKLESSPTIAQEVNEAEEKEIDGFLNDHDQSQSDEEDFMNPSKKRKLMD
ncbi:uncharacterized protein MELLADRAFT_115329 [Melampsora larici-populina 98AG31]|uniref:Uncharacterized protein n=1 Tax=Melampsora larici-populina (strain 98AG31 / pathotype 3-4-7) TaxID=747676 RepID=F4R933_MELLP|nr:uncharacterized protein MELLADRAFT_115329 [Melampsora larici-populina 98AG31]EGG11225.1 hypothetical protein MELLADRAFT_115329 [Melampsora larici-populina 98AG31]